MTGLSQVKILCSRNIDAFVSLNIKHQASLIISICFEIYRAFQRTNKYTIEEERKLKASEQQTESPVKYMHHQHLLDS